MNANSRDDLTYKCYTRARKEYYMRARMPMVASLQVLSASAFAYGANLEQFEEAKRMINREAAECLSREYPRTKLFGDFWFLECNSAEENDNLFAPLIIWLK